MTQERSGRSDGVNRKPRLRQKEWREEAIGGEGSPSENRKSTGSEIHEPQPNTTEMRDGGYAAGASGQATRRGNDAHSSREEASNEDRAASNKGHAPARRRDAED